VITLSAPHSGSQLADLAYSSWAGWLSGILGSKNDAVYSLQTGYMSKFRAQTDAHANSRKNRIYTFGGTKWGSFGSSLYWGGLYLSSYGSNDGAVTVQSSRLSYGTEIRTGSWDHTSIKKGSSTFLLFEPYLRSTAAAESINLISEENNAVRASYYYRGGEFTGTQQESFNVEESVSGITVDWMSSSPSTKLALDSPDGKADYHSFKTIKADGIFEGAYHHQVVIPKPQKGKWRLTALNSSGEAYFLNVAFLSADNDAISLLPINKQNQNIAFKINQAKLQKEFEAFVIVDHFQTKTKKQTKKVIKSIKKAGIGLELKQEGIYNITVDIRGKTQNGDIFERTIVQTVYVDSSGKIFSQ
jgi:triacylglycerol lipase